MHGDDFEVSALVNEFVAGLLNCISLRGKSMAEIYSACLRSQAPRNEPALTACCFRKSHRITTEPAFESDIGTTRRISPATL